MLDFFQIATKEVRGGVIEVRPDFTVGRSKDLMVRGQSFYAIWDEALGLWTTDEYDVQRLVDEAIEQHADKLKNEGVSCSPKYLRNFSNGGWAQFRKYMKNVSDNSRQLDAKLTFANTEVKKSDYVSRRLPYALVAGDHSAWDEMLDFLYGDEERAKIEWAIGAIISGDSRKLEKFLVFYGPGGTGKSTVLKIVEKLFVGYTAMFEAKALVGNNNSFATEAFKSNPLVAIQHDGDLSKIEDNTKLNSIVGHDKMLINEKYKPGYEMMIQAFLFMGTNKPVKITDAKSGLIRRLIDVKPTGNKFEPNHYFALMSKIEFELGAIAHHCLETYRSMGKNNYNLYQPLEMMLQTDVFFNFIEATYDIFKRQNGATLKQAFALYKEYVVEAELEYKLPLYKFRDQLKNYFDEFDDRILIDGIPMRSYYSGFNAQPYKAPVEPITKPPVFSLVMDETESLLDELFMDLPAQYGNSAENPKLYWTDQERLIKGVMQKPKPEQIVSTTMSEIDSSKLHFVKVPENHIVIDFDMKGDDGEKSLEKNLEAASAWPPTYAELSKSGGGVHLHYTYDGDASELASLYSSGIEIKVFRGNSSLRRKLTKCNSVPVSSISGGLPFKEKKPMLDQKTLQSERGLRDLIARNVAKEFHSGTKPSMDFIQKILDDAYQSGMVYDVTDLRPRLMAFANDSTNQSQQCMRTLLKMKFKSDEAASEAAIVIPPEDQPIVIYDVEVYPNLFVVCWKYLGSPTVVRMINPHAQEIGMLLGMKLVGFYNRDYDNHILHAAFMGYSVEELYKLSQKLISGERGAKFGEAYNLSYADIYDFSSVKMSLKKFQIALKIRHKEMELPWDQPVPKELWSQVVEYCVNDVISTEAVLDDREQDLVARQLLASLSGLPVNDTTRTHVTRIIFGSERNPQKSFIYTDLSKEFPGYKFDTYSTTDKSTYRGETVGEGGYVYAEPGIYENVVLLDIASMHPTSIEQLDLFGPYTAKYSALKRARIAIKNANTAWDKGEDAKALKLIKEADELLPGVQVTKENAKQLAEALKLALNSTYGWTSATFPNAFKDIRNIDNIVAKRGALFMIDLKHAIQEQGFTVAHIKTDSVKIPNATSEIIQFITEFGKNYGYDFNEEATYDKLCLANEAVYIAKTVEKDPPGAYECKWTAVGAQFQEPFVFKTLFSGDSITFDDLCVTKSVAQGAAIYLDFDSEERIPGTTEGMHFVGRTGRFMPVLNKDFGGILYRVKDGKAGSIGGTKGYLWMEAEVVASNFDIDAPFFDPEVLEGTVDLGYFERLADEARKTIEEFGSYKEFVS